MATSAVLSAGWSGQRGLRTNDTVDQLAVRAPHLRVPGLEDVLLVLGLDRGFLVPAHDLALAVVLVIALALHEQLLAARRAERACGLS